MNNDHPVKLCTLKNKFICQPEQCEKYQNGKCDTEKHALYPNDNKT